MATADILARQDNWAIVQLPSRRFPAIAMQGDTFSILADGVRRGMAGCPPGESLDELTSTLKEMERALAWYADVLRQNGLDAPWRDQTN